ncbi:hypothetical protein ILUMI_02617, partial [Ignelater luminosus]
MRKGGKRVILATLTAIVVHEKCRKSYSKEHYVKPVAVEDEPHFSRSLFDHIEDVVETYPPLEAFLDKVEDDIPESLKLLFTIIICPKNKGDQSKLKTKISCLAHGVILATRSSFFASNIKLALIKLVYKKYGSSDLVAVISAAGIQTLLEESGALDHNKTDNCEEEDFSEEDHFEERDGRSETERDLDSDNNEDDDVESLPTAPKIQFKKAISLEKTTQLFEEII